MPVSDSSGGFWKSVRQLPDRTALRVKLITAVLALVAIALAVISLAGISVMRSFLIGQADDQIAAFYPDAENAVQHYVFNPAINGASGFFVTWTPDGGTTQEVVQPQQGFGNAAIALAGPNVPTSAQWLTANAGKPVTLGAQPGGRTWRVEVFPHLGFDGPNVGSVTGTMILAVDVTSYYASVAQLAHIDLIVSALVLAGLAVLGVALVRASLRPLADIEATARDIAAGDLTRRVPDRDPRTEVGRLGRSLNAMLAQIETAFRARADSESAARRSEERMRQFVADASHELRTPLTAIRGFAEYYRQRGGVSEAPAAPSVRPASNGRGADLTAIAPDAAAPDAAAPDAASSGATAAGAGAGATGAGASSRDAGPLGRADLDRIMRRVEQESTRMGVLVEDMLLLARLDQQRPLEHHTVDLLTLAADAVHDARVVAPDRGIDLTVGSGAALLVMGDEVRLRQVIGNLMSNALAHTPDGTPIEVRIRSGSLDEGRGRAPADPGPSQRSAAVLEVADRGPGLTPEQAEHAFERFYRADQARTSGGTGLGLAIVAALVAAHGGTVWVESPPGGGAIFRIALPLTPEAISADEDPDDHEAEPDAGPEITANTEESGRSAG